jgi:hypothetical protein
MESFTITSGLPRMVRTGLTKQKPKTSGAWKLTQTISLLPELVLQLGIYVQVVLIWLGSEHARTAERLSILTQEIDRLVSDFGKVFTEP